MQTVIIKDNKHTVPSSLNELSREQLVRITEAIPISDRIEGKLKALYVLFECWKNVSMARVFSRFLSPEETHSLLPAVDFLYEENRLTEQKIERFFIVKNFMTHHFYGPKSRLKNLVFVEFISCELYLQDFRNTGNIAFLNKIVAVLYRPKKLNFKANDPNDNGDIRERFVDHNLAERAKLIDKLDHNVKMAILLFYDGCRRALMEKYTHIFIKEEEEEQGTKKKQPQKETYSWAYILDDLATDITKMEEVAYKSLNSILFHLNKKREEQKKQEAEERRKAATRKR